MLKVYEARRATLKKIPHFWAAALGKVDQVSQLLAHSEDQAALAYLEDIWVDFDPVEFRALTLEMVSAHLHR